MLANADILLLVDESGSNTNSLSQAWVGEMIDDLSTHFGQSEVNINAKYGLIGFGEQGRGPDTDPNVTDDDVTRFSHSHLLGQEHFTGSDTTLSGAIDNNLASYGAGGTEDGWDALEHAIAEYEFRTNAVPLIVIVQGDEGRRSLNETLTRDGIVTAIQSKNAIVNSLVAGRLLADGMPFGNAITESDQLLFHTTVDPDSPPLENQPDASWAPVFDLAQYETTTDDFDDIYVLGVESDATDGASDGQHTYHAFDTVQHEEPTVSPTTRSDALQVSFNGSNTGETGMVGSGKSILISESLVDGIGGVPSDGNDYRAKSVPFAAIDMTGATVGSAAGSVSFAFDFFGANYSQLWTNEDGTLTFSSASFQGENADLSTLLTGATDNRPTQPMIAVLWDNLRAGFNPTSGQILHRQADFDGDSQTDLAVQWTDYIYETDSGENDSLTFQAVLYDSGDIRLNYLDIDSYSNNNGEPTIDSTGGISATVGIWNGSADPITLPAGKFVPGPHTIFTDSSGETADSYVRMAWDTGGAAWDIGVVDRYGSTSDEANALRDAFIDSLGDQILRAEVEGKVFRDDVVVTLPSGDPLQINVGGPTTGVGTAQYLSDTDPLIAPFLLTSVSNTTTHTKEPAPLEVIDLNSNSVPSGSDLVFETSREVSGGTGNMQWSIPSSALPDGAYIIELLFAELDAEDTSPRTFDVVAEGQMLLNDYIISQDRARIVDFGAGDIELNSVIADGIGRNSTLATAVVKRFEVDVVGGLQIDLLSESIEGSSLNGLRILQADAPRVENVVVKGSGWADGVEFSFDQIVGRGEQFRPIFTENADTIEIHFDDPVNIANGMNGAFELRGKNDSTVPIATFDYDEVNYIATWTFDPVDFVGDKYAIHLSAFDVTGGNGQMLDGDWTNDHAGTFDDFSDDPAKTLVSGDGTEGSTANEFRFHFAVLPGDYNQDGIVDSADTMAAVVRDGDGDGDVDAADTAIASSNAGDVLPLRPNSGDMSSIANVDFGPDNDAVDLVDWVLFKGLYGGSDSRSDFNDDMVTNLTDFTIFRNNYPG